MKQVTIIVLTLLIVLGTIFGVYYYIHDYSRHFTPDQVELTTALPKNTQNEKSDVLLAQMENPDFKLYLNDKTVKLEHDGQVNEFTDWSQYIGKKAPEMYYGDFDSDKEDELLIKAAAGTDYNINRYYYELYMLSPKKQEDGTYKYDIVLINNATWSWQFDNYVKCELSNLENDNSRVQVAMDLTNKTIAYDKKTGIAKCKSVGFARNLFDSKGNYYKLKTWSKGIGQYQIEDGNKIGADIPIYVTYDKTDAQQLIGNVHIGITVTGAAFSITEKSIYFTAADEYRVSDPRTAANQDWSYTIKNLSNSAPTTDKTINWIDDTFTLNKTDSESLYFASLSSKIKAIDNIVITNNTVSLTAKKGYSFAKVMLNNIGYSVVINAGTDDEFVVSKSAVINTDSKSGAETLVIHLDKSYPRSEIKTLTVKYGS